MSAMYPGAARQNRRIFVTGSAADVLEINRVATDAELTPDGRSKRSAAAHARIVERYESLRDKTAGLVESARREFAAVRPGTKRLASVLKDPMRAFALRELYADAAPAELRLLAEEANRNPEAPDLVLQFAIKAIVSRRLADISDKDRQSISDATDAGMAPAASKLLAALVVTHAELQRLESDRALLTGAMLDPVASLTAARRVQQIDLGAGERRQLTQLEVESMYALLDIPLANPPEITDAPQIKADAALLATV